MPGRRPPITDVERIASILDDLDAEHEAWRALLAALPEQAARRSAGGHWSALETLVHVTSWKENAVRVARMQAQAQAPDPGPAKGTAGVLHINVDAFNAEAVQAKAAWSTERILAWGDRVHGELVSAIRALPPERVLNGRGRHGARMWIWIPGSIHCGGHRRDLLRRIGRSG